MKRHITACTILSLALAACGVNEDDRVKRVEEPDTQVDPQPVAEGVERATRFAPDPRPVRVGFDGPEFDACGSYGVITGLNPDGDNFLSVRAAPTTEAEELDRITTGTGVSLCEDEGGWIGIVYTEAGSDSFGCEVGSPVPSLREYDGPCRSGWVSQRFVELIAG